ncbi:MAG: hypothetical protein KGI33_10505 [Thaumarchaeota archaeon]|nr:hypothetical protein [Nitrososphaerota archaeon]
MQKNGTKTLSIFVMAVLVLVPVLQSLPLNLPSLLPEASAQPWYSVSLQSHNSTSTNGTSASFNLNVGTNTDRLLVVAIEANNYSASSVTFGGKSLIRVAKSFHNDDTEFWYLTNPNGTNTVKVNMNGNTGIVAGAYAFYGVDEGNPIPTTATNHTYSTPINANPHISLNTEYSNSEVVDSASTYGGGSLSSPTCTQGWEIKNTKQVTGASSYTNQASAGAVKCQWTNSVSNPWDDAAIEIKAAGSQPQSSPIILNGKSTDSGWVPATSAHVTLYNFTAGTGNNRLLVVGIASDSQSANSVTFGGTTLTKAVSSFVNNDAEFWYLKNPTGNGNIVVTMSGGSELASYVIGAYAFANVNQTTPIPTTNSTNGNGNPSVSIKTASPNDLIFDQPSIYGGSKLSNPTCLQQWDSNVQTTSSFPVSKITGASSMMLVPVSSTTVTCSWTNSISTNTWDDVAIELKGVSLTASTGILIPLYSYPTNGTNTLSTYWNSVYQTKLSYPLVPIFAIINPDSGSCGSTCPDTNYEYGISQLNKSGVTVLGYTYTAQGTRTFAPVTSAKSLENDTSNYTKWYKPYGLNGINFDEYATTINSHQEVYYSNATKNVHITNGLTYSFGNPGAKTFSTYINSGSADLLDIWEDNVTLPSYQNLAGNTYSQWTGSGSLGTTDLGFDKHNFSFLSWNITKANFPNNATLGNYSNFVGLFYITDNTGCAPNVSPCPPPHQGVNPWNTTSTYLTNMTKALNHPSSIITINSTDSSGKPITGAFVQINQTNQTIPSGFSPYSFQGTQTIKYLFTPENYSSTCTFHNWKNGPSTATRTIIVNSTSAAFTLNYIGSGCP